MNTRGRYWVEAESNIIEANKIGSLSDLSFWANLLAAIANATMASAPDGVMQEVEAIAEEKQRIQSKLQKRIKDNLRGKNP